MQLPLAGAEAEPEPTNTPAAIKAATDAENRACRMTPPLKWDRSLRLANRFVKPYLATLFKSARSRTTTLQSPIGCCRVSCRVLAERRHAPSSCTDLAVLGDHRGGGLPSAYASAASSTRSRALAKSSSNVKSSGSRRPRRNLSKLS